MLAIYMISIYELPRTAAIFREIGPLCGVVEATTSAGAVGETLSLATTVEGLGDGESSEP